MDIEAEVRKILKECTELHTEMFGGMSVQFADLNAEKATRQLCHLFPKTEDNPDGEGESCPNELCRHNKWNSKECYDCGWTEAISDIAYKEVTAKPTKGRLLPDEEMVEKCMPTLERFEEVEKQVFYPIPKPPEFSATIRIYASTMSREAVRKTLNKTASIKDQEFKDNCAHCDSALLKEGQIYELQDKLKAECRAKLKGIKEKIENECTTIEWREGMPPVECLSVVKSKLDAVWKGVGV